MYTSWNGISSHAYPISTNLINQTLNQSMGQTTNQPTNQSVNQSISQSISQFLFINISWEIRNLYIVKHPFWCFYIRIIMDFCTLHNLPTGPWSVHMVT